MISFQLEKIPEISDATSNLPIEILIKQSCSNYEDSTVQKLVEMTQTQFNGELNAELLEQTQLAPDGVQRNRQRFSFVSVYNLALRFLPYIRGYLWKEWLFAAVCIIGYGVSLTFFFNRRIIYPSGCINPGEDDTNACAKTVEQVKEEFDLMDNYRYQFFISKMYFILILICSTINFRWEFDYFENEHRNGKN